MKPFTWHDMSMTTRPIRDYNETTTGYVIRSADSPVAFVLEHDDGYRAWLPDGIDALVHSPCLADALIDLNITGVVHVVEPS